ncbi:MAG: hypothetical protein KDA96_13125, partial [Planctomycetaceae bacterium]|nr:hypothetical protein [Planctomycetaceae bacterium]
LPMPPGNGATGSHIPPGMLYGFVPLDPYQAILRLDQAHPGPAAPHRICESDTGRTPRRRAEIYQTELYFG